MKKHDPKRSLVVSFIVYSALTYPVDHTGEAVPWTSRPASVKLSDWRGEFPSNLV